MILEDASGFSALMDGEVVEDDDIAPAERGSELRFDPQVEGSAVQGFVDDPWRGERVAAQAGDEGLRVPVAEGRGAKQPLTAPGAATQSDHLGGDGGFVDEDKACRLVTHPDLPLANPHAPRLGHVGAFALRGHQGFFYM